MARTENRISPLNFPTLELVKSDLFQTQSPDATFDERIAISYKRARAICKAYGKPLEAIDNSQLRVLSSL